MAQPVEDDVRARSPDDDDVDGQGSTEDRNRVPPQTALHLVNTFIAEQLSSKRNACLLRARQRHPKKTADSSCHNKGGHENALAPKESDAFPSTAILFKTTDDSTIRSTSASCIYPESKNFGSPRNVATSWSPHSCATSSQFLSRDARIEHPLLHDPIPSIEDVSHDQEENVHDQDKSVCHLPVLRPQRRRVSRSATATATATRNRNTTTTSLLHSGPSQGDAIRLLREQERHAYFAEVMPDFFLPNRVVRVGYSSLPGLRGNIVQIFTVVASMSDPQGHASDDDDDSTTDTGRQKTTERHTDSAVAAPPSYHISNIYTGKPTTSINWWNFRQRLLRRRKSGRARQLLRQERFWEASQSWAKGFYDLDDQNQTLEWDQVEQKEQEMRDFVQRLRECHLIHS